MDAEEIFHDFDEVYEIVPGRCYELVTGMEKFRMVISRSMVGPLDFKINFDQLVSVAYERGSTLFEGPDQMPQLWSPIGDCVATQPRGTTEEVLLSTGAFYLGNWLKSRAERES